MFRSAAKTMPVRRSGTRHRLHSEPRAIGASHAREILAGQRGPLCGGLLSASPRQRRARGRAGFCYDRAVNSPPWAPWPRLARGCRLPRIFITLAASFALAGCDRRADETAAPESTESERSTEKGEPAPPEDTPAAEEGGAESGAGAASKTLVVDGPLRVEFPPGFPEPVAHREEGELRGFAFSTTTYESFAEHLGLVAASVSEYDAEAFDELTPAYLLDGVKQTLLGAVTPPGAAPRARIASKARSDAPILARHSHWQFSRV